MAWKEVIVTAQGPGPAHTAISTVSLLPPQAIVPLAGNFFSVPGKRLHLHAGGKFSSAITTPGIAQFTVKLGAIVVFDSLQVLLDTVAAHTNIPWTLDIWMNLLVTGSAANFVGHGEFKCEAVKGSGTMPLGSLVAMLPWNATPAAGNNFDATVSNTLDLQHTQTVATGSITLQDYEAETQHTE